MTLSHTYQAYTELKKEVFPIDTIKSSKEKRLTIALLGAVFLVMMIFNCLTPLLADDFTYSFSFANGNRLSSLKDVFYSMQAHRLIMNGRIIAHSLTSIFLILPKLVFNIVNALNYTLILWLMYRFFKGREGMPNFLLLLGAVFSLWIFTPVYGQVFLWLDGAVNYSWSITLSLAMLYPYFRAYTMEESTVKRPLVSRILFLALGFTAGAYSEHCSCALLFMCFCFILLVWRKNGKLPVDLSAAFLCGCVGFLLLMFAPAEAERACDFSFITIAHNIRAVVAYPYDMMMPLYCIFAALMALAIVLRVDRRILISCAVMFLGGVVSLGVFALALYLPLRAMLTATVYLIVPSLILLKSIHNHGMKSLLPIAVSVAGMIFLFSFVLGAGDIGVTWYESQLREKTIYAALEAGETSVELHTYEPGTKHSAAYTSMDLYNDPTLWPNTDMAKYYGLSEITGIAPIDYGE